MIERVCIIVLDSVGIGALPDAELFGDEGAHTLGNIYKKRGYLRLPNLYSMGLGNIEGSGLPSVDAPCAAYGRMAAKTFAKDTTSGHWEIAGLIMDKPFGTFPQGFPTDALEKWVQQTGLPGYLGNTTASGTEIIELLGAEHMRTGMPIVYTSADSVFQVAAHEEIIPLTELYRICEYALPLFPVGRVIARPFLGKPGSFKRTENRKDYAVPPVGETILDALAASGQKVLGIGKIEDIFCRRGIAYVNHTKNNKDGIAATIDALNREAEAFADARLIFTNLVDFDMLYGHRNDTEGYAQALEYFDTRLPEIIRALKPGDALFITADHGCDPTTPSTDHSREYVPVLVYGTDIKPVSLGTRESFADLGATVYTMLIGANDADLQGSFEKWTAGKSFLSDISFSK